jgi:hypothetical protein
MCSGWSTQLPLHCQRHPSYMVGHPCSNLIINCITTKANKTLGFLCRNINISSTTVKEQAYKSLVRPSFEYACSVWDPYTTEENTTRLEQVQRRAARYVTNRYHNTSNVSNMIEHLNWRSLADRRSDARLAMLYKISHELVAIPKQTYSYHNLDSHGTCTHSHTNYHQHLTTQTAIFLSANNTKLEQSPPEHSEE